MRQQEEEKEGGESGLSPGPRGQLHTPQPAALSTFYLPFVLTAFSERFCHLRAKEPPFQLCIKKHASKIPRIPGKLGKPNLIFKLIQRTGSVSKKPLK